MTTLRNVNLNLLPVLHALVHHQNVTRAGEALNMSQSAVSDALANLRHEFSDELLVRKGRSMVLTDLARSLTPQLEEAIGSIQRLLGTPGFEPERLTRRFVLATADSVTMTIGPALVSALGERAPAASLQFVEFGASTLKQASTGEVDLLIAPHEIALPGLKEASLYDEEFVCIMRKNHPLARKRLTRKAYSAAKHVSYRPTQTGEETLEVRILRREGARQFDVARVPQFTLLPCFVEASDCIAMVPRRVAERMQATSDIRIAKLPFQSERVPMSLYWSAIKHNDPAHRWLRDTLCELSLLEAQRARPSHRR